MQMYVVTAVRIERDRVTAVKMGLADTDTDAWVREPVEVPVIDVVDLLMRDRRVGTTYPVANGGMVPGPYLRTRVLSDGVESIETIRTEDSDRTIEELPRF